LTDRFFTGRMPFLSPNQQRQSTKWHNSYNISTDDTYNKHTAEFSWR